MIRKGVPSFSRSKPMTWTMLGWNSSPMISASSKKRR